MNKRIKKKAEKSFEKDYFQIVKDSQLVGQQWTGTGDAFVKFSLYEHQPTVATPYTTLEGLELN